MVSHDANSIRSTPVESSQSILLFASSVDVVGIDEAQFFDVELVNVCNELANQGVRVIVAGLDMDFRGLPLALPALMASAEYVTKVHAICVICGNLANHSHRIDSSNESLVLLGETETYQPLCRDCFMSAIPAHTTNPNEADGKLPDG